MVMVLIGLLGFGMVFGGCENGTTDNNGSTPPTEKVVAEKYWGTWMREGIDATIIIEKTSYRHNQNPVERVWTVGTDLMANQEKIGTFQDETTFFWTSDTSKSMPWIKQ
jgi:hypothetical protein